MIEFGDFVDEMDAKTGKAEALMVLQPSPLIYHTNPIQSLDASQAFSLSQKTNPAPDKLALRI